MMEKGKSLEGFPPTTQLVFFFGKILLNFDFKIFFLGCQIFMISSTR